MLIILSFYTVSQISTTLYWTTVSNIIEYGRNNMKKRIEEEKEEEENLLSSASSSTSVLSLSVSKQEFGFQSQSPYLGFQKRPPNQEQD